MNWSTNMFNGNVMEYFRKKIKIWTKQMILDSFLSKGKSSGGNTMLMNHNSQLVDSR
jgi:hypothetical protein